MVETLVQHWLQRRAIRASVVSGALNGRMLWWQDGYDQSERADLCRHYHEVAAPAAAFRQRPLGAGQLQRCAQDPRQKRVPARRNLVDPLQTRQ